MLGPQVQGLYGEHEFTISLWIKTSSNVDMMLAMIKDSGCHSGAWTWTINKGVLESKPEPA